MLQHFFQWKHEIWSKYIFYELIFLALGMEKGYWHDPMKNSYLDNFHFKDVATV